VTPQEPIEVHAIDPGQARSAGHVGLAAREHRFDVGALECTIPRLARLLERQPGEVEALLPVELDGTPIQASLGRVHGCAVLDDGRVRCWGSGASGGTGHGSTADRGHAPGTMGTALPATTLSAPFDPALQVGTGEFYSCALLQSRRVKCWGEGLYGRHGGGTTDDLGDQPSEMGNALQALPLP
jgi:hypothetical protein